MENSSDFITNGSGCLCLLVSCGRQRTRTARGELRCCVVGVGERASKRERVLMVFRLPTAKCFRRRRYDMISLRICTAGYFIWVSLGCTTGISWVPTHLGATLVAGLLRIFTYFISLILYFPFPQSFFFLSFFFFLFFLL